MPTAHDQTVAVMVREINRQFDALEAQTGPCSENAHTLVERVKAMDTPEMLALDVECGRCKHMKGRHGPWPFETDKTMRCHSCWIDGTGGHECDSHPFSPPPSPQH